MSRSRAARPHRSALVVIGSPRSGTSAMTRALDLAGLGALPADTGPPDPVDDPAGLWESRAVIAMNEAVLAGAGGSWDRPPDLATIAASRIERAVDRAVDLLAHQYGDAPSILLKDPRISLLVPLWDAALARLGVRPTYVVMVRHPAEVAASLLARGGLGEGAAVALWTAYMRAAEAGTRGLARTFVPFDDLLTDWRGVLGRVARAGGAADLALYARSADAVAGFLSPARRRRRREDPPPIGDGGPARRAYDALARGSDEAALRAEIDALFGVPRPPSAAPGRSAAAAKGPAWLLVTGAPRSGTSLLRAILTDHPRVALLQEYGLTGLVRRIDAIVDRAPAASEDWDSPGDPGDDAFNAASRFYRDRPDRAAVARGGGDPGPEQFGAVAMGLFEGLFPGKDLAIVGDKMPIAAAWEDLPLLFERLPGLRIVAVIRNPADVVRSSLVRRAATQRGRDTWPIRTVEAAVAQWISAWRTLRAMRIRHGAALKVVKYEDLCDPGRDTATGIWDWLGLPAHRSATRISSLPPGLAQHTAAEQAVVERHLGAIIGAWPNADAESLMCDYDVPQPPYVFGEPIQLAQEEADAYLVSGFSFREEWGRWTDGPSAVVSIPHGLERGLLLVEIGVLQAFVRTGEATDVVVRCGWSEPKLFHLTQGRSRIAFLAQAEEAEDRGRLRFEVVIVRPKSPDEPPPDSRALGILVETITVSCLPEPDTGGAGRPAAPR